MSSFSLADLQELSETIEGKLRRAYEAAERYELQLGIVNARIERLEEEANDPENYDD